MKDIIEISIKMKKVDSGQYFCKGQRLSFDLPWTIYIVNGDFYELYYRVYIGEQLMSINHSLEKSYEYVTNVTHEEAHIAEM